MGGVLTSFDEATGGNLGFSDAKATAEKAAREAKFNAFDVTGPSGSTFTTEGNQATFALGGQQQAIQNQLFGRSAQFLGQDAGNISAPELGLGANFTGSFDQAMQMGQGFNAASQNFLQQSQTTPTADFTGIDEFLAGREARETDQMQANLLRTGRMGSTGGSRDAAALSQAQGERAFQLASQSEAQAFGRQQQLSNMAGTMSGAAQQSQAFGLQGALSQQNLFNQNFQNALTSRQANLQAQSGLQSLGLQALGATQAQDAAALQQGAFGANLGAQRAGAAVNAGNFAIEGAGIEMGFTAGLLEQAASGPMGG